MTSEFTIGVHSLVYLNHKKETVSSEALAENVCTNPARIRKVMAKLKKAGFVQTKEGNRGGFQICDNGDAITLKEVAEALSEVIVKSGWKSGSVDMDCLVSSGMAAIMENIYQGLNEVSFNYLDGITIGRIDDLIFKDNK